ncbi:MAG: WXG100 family type VII secretion target [Acidothermaceae bacterium]
MPGAGVGTFTVSPDDLVDLAARVADVQGYLDGTRDLVDDVSAALGSEVVASALDHFVSGWRDGRKQISTEVGALSQMIGQAASVYADTDGSLAASIPGGGS